MGWWDVKGMVFYYVFVGEKFYCGEGVFEIEDLFGLAFCTFYGVWLRIWFFNTFFNYRARPSSDKFHNIVFFIKFRWRLTNNILWRWRGSLRMWTITTFLLYLRHLLIFLPYTWYFKLLLNLNMTLNPLIFFPMSTQIDDRHNLPGSNIQLQSKLIPCYIWYFMFLIDICSHI